VYKNCDAKVPMISDKTIDEIYLLPIFIKMQEIVQNNVNLMEKFNINEVLENIIYLAEQANIYIDQKAPWALKKIDPTKMHEVLYSLMEIIRHIAIMLQPFTPDSAARILDQLSIPVSSRNFAHLTKEHALTPGDLIPEPTPIFPRLDK
jgi:methionyl-tRNA synthetase